VVVTNDRYTHVTEAAILETTVRLNDYYAKAAELAPDDVVDLKNLRLAWVDPYVG
jgi:hypothetical protein